LAINRQPEELEFRHKSPAGKVRELFKPSEDAESLVSILKNL